MTSIGQYGFINAKVRAMRSFLLTESIYRAMAAAHNLQESLSILSQTRLKTLVEKLKIKDPTDIEQMLIREEIHRLQIIEMNSRGNVSELVSLFLERYEAERLKALLREWHHKQSDTFQVYREKILYDLPVESIVTAEKLADIVDLLEGTPFQKVLAGAVPDYSERRSLFPLELAIDRDLFGRLWEATEPFGRKDRRIARRLLGIEIDLKNLNWISRFRRYYQISSADIAELLLPHGYRLGSEKMRHVITGGSVLGVLGDVVQRTEIALPEEGEEGVDLDVLERFLYHALFIEAKRAFGEFPFSIGAIFGYFYLMRIETKNVRTILQAKAYGLTPEEIEALLVL